MQTRSIRGRKGSFIASVSALTLEETTETFSECTAARVPLVTAQEETLAPSFMDSALASSATCAISHRVPSITVPQTDKQRPEKINESTEEAKKISQRFCSIAGNRAAAAAAPSERAQRPSSLGLREMDAGKVGQKSSTITYCAS